MTEQQPPASRKRRFARSLGWIFKTTIVLLLLIALIFALTGGGAIGFTELQRSFDSLEAKVTANEANIDSLRDLVNSEFAQGDTEQQVAIDALRRDVDGLDADLTAVQEQLVADMARQEEMLNELETSLMAVTESSEDNSTELSTQSEALLALQGDVIANSVEIDTVGGNADALRLDVTTLDEGVGTLNEDVAELTAVSGEERQQVAELLTLFRVWELITRARLRLLENNVGLAQDDVDTALALVETMQISQTPTLSTTAALSTTDPISSTEGISSTAVLTPTATLSNTITLEESPAADPFAPLYTRLSLAAANLPADPETAVADLELAWDELDALLAAQLTENGTTPKSVSP